MSENNELKNCELIPNGSDELKPPSPAGGLETRVWPKREFVRLPTSIPNDLALEGTLKSDNNEPTNLEVAPDSNHHHEPQPACGFATSTLDLPPDANREDDEISSRLGPKKMLAAVALALGQSESNVARFVRVNRTTVYRWQQEADFVAEMNRQKREYLAEQRTRLRTLLEQAIATLDSCMQRQDGDMIKLKAAMFIVSHFAPRAHETIGPITERGVKKVWKDEATRLSTSNEVHLIRVTEP